MEIFGRKFAASWRSIGLFLLLQVSATCLAHEVVFSPKLLAEFPQCQRWLAESPETNALLNSSTLREVGLFKELFRLLGRQRPADPSWNAMLKEAFVLMNQFLAAQISAKPNKLTALFRDIRNILRDDPTNIWVGAFNDPESPDAGALNRVKVPDEGILVDHVYFFEINFTRLDKIRLVRTILHELTHLLDTNLFIDFANINIALPLQKRHRFFRKYFRLNSTKGTHSWDEGFTTFVFEARAHAVEIASLAKIKSLAEPGLTIAEVERWENQETNAIFRILTDPDEYYAQAVEFMAANDIPQNRMFETAIRIFQEIRAFVGAHQPEEF